MGKPRLITRCEHRLPRYSSLAPNALIAVPKNIAYTMDMNPKVEYLQSQVSPWCRRRAVDLCVLFGSQATGRAHADSDVDIACWPSTMPAPLEKLAWLVEVERLVDHEVNLLFVTPRLDPVLGWEIGSHGVVLYEARPEHWYEERLRLWHLYNDAQPFIRREREALHRFAEEVRRGA